MALPAAAAASFLAAREGWRAWQPARLLLAGRYEEARESAESLEVSWMRAIPGVRLSARHAIACALHLSGDLEGSLAATASIPRPRYEVDSLDAASLVLLDREPERVIELIRSTAPARMPEDRLLEALARQRLGEESVQLDDETVTGDRAAIVHFLRGLYRLRAGRDDHAKRDLRRAADAPHANVYTRRARMLLEERPADEGPSSLDPQVVAKREPPR